MFWTTELPHLMWLQNQETLATRHCLRRRYRPQNNKRNRDYHSGQTVSAMIKFIRYWNDYVAEDNSMSEGQMVKDTGEYDLFNGIRSDENEIDDEDDSENDEEDESDREDFCLKNSNYFYNYHKKLCSCLCSPSTCDLANCYSLPNGGIDAKNVYNENDANLTAALEVLLVAIPYDTVFIGCVNCLYPIAFDDELCVVIYSAKHRSI